MRSVKEIQDMAEQMVMAYNQIDDGPERERIHSFLAGLQWALGNERIEL